MNNPLLPPKSSTIPSNEVPVNTYLLSGYIGVIHKTSEEEFVPYEQREMEYQSTKELTPRDTDHYRDLARHFLWTLVPEMLQRVPTDKRRFAEVDLLSFGFRKVVKP